MTSTNKSIIIFGGWGIRYIIYIYILCILINILIYIDIYIY
nr:MAG TPA: hypothetical protein [Caudoviricetes sp.]